VICPTGHECATTTPFAGSFSLQNRVRQKTIFVKYFKLIGVIKPLG
jgi:hypothetical protein